MKDGPAAKAGIEAGDVILKFDGKEISRSADLPPIVAKVKPGSTVALEMWRDGKAKTSRRRSARSPMPPSSPTPRTSRARASSASRCARCRRRNASRPTASTGVVVENVAGAAAKAGVRPGDVIVAVNNTPVKSPEQLKELIGKAGKTVALLIQRDEARIFIPVTLG